MMVDCIQEATALGFDGAAMMDVAELTFVPAYRAYCAENLCGNYGALPACPPACGTVAEMELSARAYDRALVLTTVTAAAKPDDEAAMKAAKRRHNLMTEALMERMRAGGSSDLLMMGAGPWKNASCMSAYCIDAQKMADRVGMKCWENDGKVRFFSLILLR